MALYCHAPLPLPTLALAQFPHCLLTCNAIFFLFLYIYIEFFTFFTLQAPATLRLCRQQLFIRQFPPAGAEWPGGREAQSICTLLHSSRARGRGAGCGVRGAGGGAGMDVACRASEQIFIMSSRVESSRH